MTSPYRSPGRVVNFLFCLMQIHCCTGPLGRRAVGRQVKGFLWKRSVELRASGAVGLRWQAAFGVKNAGLSAQPMFLCQVAWVNRTCLGSTRKGRSLAFAEKVKSELGLRAAHP